MKKFIYIFLLLILASCATTPKYESDWDPIIPIDGVSRVIYEPELNNYAVGRLGNSLVSKSFIREKDAIQLLSDYKSGLVPLFSTDPNKPFAPSEPEIIKITPKDKVILRMKGASKNKITGEIAECFSDVSSSIYISDIICIVDNKYIENWHHLSRNGDPSLGLYFTTSSKNTQYKKLKVEDRSEDYFKQEFIYNGRVNNSLKFIYREFSEDIARPSFTQEVQYDLNQSSIIGFKNLSMEILKATNQEIEYRIITPF